MKNEKYIYRFSQNGVDGNIGLIKLLGGKGANLAEMCNLKIPVPPGFTVSTEVCNYFLKHNTFPASFKSQLLQAIHNIENELGLKFGDSNNPLLFSVRSGARQSMPGMMETVLNVGLTSKTIDGLIAKTKNKHFVYDSYRRLIMMYADVVMEKAAGANLDIKNIREHLDLILMKLKDKKNVAKDSDLSVQDLKKLCSIFKDIIYAELNQKFPDDPYEQLWNAIEAVFISWNGRRAKKYREIENIPDSWGTAVTVQSMVFGNMGNNSATGVAFTRNPSNGENVFYGEWLSNAQGEDVVAGTRTPFPINNHSKNLATQKAETLESKFPDLYKNLLKIKETLENHYKDMQDIEFTIQNEKLWMLQTRSGKRNGHAAIKIAVDLYNKKMIDNDEVANRISPSQIEEIMHPYFNPKEEKQCSVLTTGLPAGPGSAVGRAVFSSEEAQIQAKAGIPVVLIREETSPEDIHGMHVANAIITSRGGMTSHAALVARGWGKCCVVGCNDMIINDKNCSAAIKGHTINQGDWLSINGSSGNIYINKIELIDTQINTDDNFMSLLNILKNTQKIGVRANADTPEDAKKAKDMGAKGIGLCRTEHMFFSPERISAIRKMILFRDDMKIRKEAIMQLLPFQKDDFYHILKAMYPHPVTIRLLDPPLHEFLPQNNEQVRLLAKEITVSENKIKSAMEQLYENNPMLGHRGCRLGISYPEITEMQGRAVLEASLDLMKEGIEVSPEIMIPLVGSDSEFKHQKMIIEKVAHLIEKTTDLKLKYKIGTMIELPRACLTADKIAQHADFFSFGTNDLTQTTFGFSRDDVSSVLSHYIENEILTQDPFQSLDEGGVGELVLLAVNKARSVNPKIKIGICGEHGGDPQSIAFFKKCGLDYVSCSPFRVPISILCTAKK